MPRPSPTTTYHSNFRCSQNIEAISEALVNAQMKFGAAVKDSNNPAYKSKYADLNSVLDAVRGPLNEQGIAILQPASLDGQMVTVTTRLQHKSGQYYESSLTLPAVQRERFDAQSVGSAITYGRRYGLNSMTGLGAQDDDGNSASGIGTREQAQEVANRKLDIIAKTMGKPVEELKKELEAKRGAYQTTFADGNPTLFFTYPAKHNGNYAEFVNIKEYVSAHMDQQAADAFRLFFSAYLSKNLRSKSGTVLVPREKMEELLQKLAGDHGLTVSELKAAE
jgi:ERF superfamily